VRNGLLPRHFPAPVKSRRPARFLLLAGICLCAGVAWALPGGDPVAGGGEPEQPPDQPAIRQAATSQGSPTGSRTRNGRIRAGSSASKTACFGSVAKVNYDAGNVMNYLDVDPVPDLRTCVEEVRSFCIKDHRYTPRDEDCGPGFGEIDHYKLLGLIAFTGRTMPLCRARISSPSSCLGPAPPPRSTPLRALLASTSSS
jgi:hypothetical protein